MEIIIRTFVMIAISIYLIKGLVEFIKGGEIIDIIMKIIGATIMYWAIEIFVI